MRQYQQLQQETQDSRRTVADAVEVLRQAAGFLESDRAQIRVGPCPLPWGVESVLVCVVFEPSCSEAGYVVSLPMSAQFKARPLGSDRREPFDISRLDGASVGSDSSVTLLDGTQLRAVELVPMRVPLEPTDLDWRIVYSTIVVIDAQDRCFRSLRAGVEPSLQEMIPDRKYLDCSTLRELVIPPMKVLLAKIAKLDPTLKKLSRQKLANTLRDFGMRVPASRPRA